MTSTVYQLSGVVKRYRKGPGEVLALRGVDLVIRDGEWLAIQGPTGHGKSTLLQILGGLDRPASGTLEFDGTDLAGLPEAKVTRDEIIALLKDLWRTRGPTMVLVTHDSAVAARAPRLGQMRDGLFEDSS